MMMSSRVFLILSALLLVHGAPTGGNGSGPVGPGGAILLNPTFDNQTPKAAKTWETPSQPAQPPAPHSEQTSITPPSPHAGQTSTEANSLSLSPHSAQSIHSTNANQSPLAESTHEHVTCVFKQGTWYLLLLANVSVICKLTQSKTWMETDGIFFTQDNTIFVPKGIAIEPSKDISFKLPSGDTKIEVMDKSDPRLAKVGIFPEGSIYYRKKFPHLQKKLKSLVLTGGEMIIITPERRIFRLEGDTTVVVLSNILRLPPSGEKIYFQEITEKDQTRIEEWCAEAYAQTQELKDEYIDTCFETNLWRVWSSKFVKVRMKKDSK